MESYEASRAVFTRIQNIDPENASKIMGYILLHYPEPDILHLSYGPETLLLSIIKTAKIHLGLSSNTLPASLLNPIPNSIPISRPDPLSISPSIWSPTHISPKSPSFNFNYGNVDFFDPNLDLDMEDSNSSSSFNGGIDELNSGFFEPCLYSNSTRGDDEFQQCREDIMIRSKNLAFFSNNNNNNNNNKQRLAAAAAQLMAANNGGFPPFINKLNFLPSDAQRSAAAAAASLMMSEDYQKLNHHMRMARFSGFMNNFDDPSSRQIYLTFPADSTFKEEDVSTYFNKFGPVQDVRIPYQQKRMFGFVTFVFPETVRIILAKGNPHFVCDSRVLVKPYKEKGKLPDNRKHHQHHFEKGEFSCSSPSEHDYREPYDFPFGGRTMYNTQEMLLRKKLEDEAEIHHALELQERRLMNLNLFDTENQQNRHNEANIPQNVTEENEELEDVSVPNKEGTSSSNPEETDLFESALPDNLFTSCNAKPASFSPARTEFNNVGSSSTSDNDSSLQPTVW